jgi:hypothetical protein
VNGEISGQTGDESARTRAYTIDGGSSAPIASTASATTALPPHPLGRARIQLSTGSETALGNSSQSFDQHLPGRVSGIEHDGAWELNLEPAGEADTRTMVSHIVDRVLNAKSSKSHEANFEMETENGETIKVRISLTGKILTGRIGVGDFGTKALIESRLWELNQRLEAEGFAPQNLGVFVLGGGSEQGKRHHYKKPHTGGMRDNRTDDHRTSTLVEMEAKTFDRWV